MIKDSTTNEPFSHGHFDFFIGIFFKGFLLQLVLKHVYNSTNKLHDFKNYFSINKNCLKVFRVLHFLLKNDHNFKSCKNMLITLNFNFLYHKLQFCSYVIHIMIHFTWQMTFEI